jgi:hypothetical protein
LCFEAVVVEVEALLDLVASEAVVEVEALLDLVASEAVVEVEALLDLVASEVVVEVEALLDLVASEADHVASEADHVAFADLVLAFDVVNPVEALVVAFEALASLLDFEAFVDLPFEVLASAFETFVVDLELEMEG